MSAPQQTTPYPTPTARLSAPTNPIPPTLPQADLMNFRPTTDQEVKDWINQLRAHSINSQTHRTNPAHHGAPSTPPTPPPTRPAAHHGAPPLTPAHHPTELLQNEATCQSIAPQSPIPSLTPLQLAALRYLVAGHRPTLVAKGLNIDRHTLLRWRRSADFQAELHRLHHQLAARTAMRPSRPSAR